jgi:hypothetical protein
MDVSTVQRPLLHLDVSTPLEPELHLNLSGLNEPLLLQDASTLKGLSCTWTYVEYRTPEPGLLLDLSYTTEACAAHGRVSKTGPELQQDVLYVNNMSELVWT